MLVKQNPAYDNADAATPTFRSTQELATERTMPWLRPADADNEYEYSKHVLPLDRWEVRPSLSPLLPFPMCVFVCVCERAGAGASRSFLVCSLALPRAFFPPFFFPALSRAC